MLRMRSISSFSIDAHQWSKHPEAKRLAEPALSGAGFGRLIKALGEKDIEPASQNSSKCDVSMGDAGTTFFHFSGVYFLGTEYLRSGDQNGRKRSRVCPSSPTRNGNRDGQTPAANNRNTCGASARAGSSSRESQSQGSDSKGDRRGPYRGCRCNRLFRRTGISRLA